MTIDADAYEGRQTVLVDAHGALVANTPYMLMFDQNGYLSAAVVDSGTIRYRIVVPRETIAAAGDEFRGQIVGRVNNLVTPSLSITAGHALEIHNALVADEGGAYDGSPNEFGIQNVTTTSATAQDMTLLNREIIGTT